MRSRIRTDCADSQARYTQLRAHPQRLLVLVRELIVTPASWLGGGWSGEEAAICGEAGADDSSKPTNTESRIHGYG